MTNKKILITEDDIELVQTCGMWPEQYDAFLDGKFVGYLRIRHGHFDCYDDYGMQIYKATHKGDGSFDDDEREKYLMKAKTAILKAIKESGKS